MKRSYIILLGLFLSTVILSSCKKDDDDEDTGFNNQYIKKTQMPLIVGEQIEFAYGMGTLSGKLTNVKVVASIAGGPGTLWEPFTWKTTTGGVNVSTVAAKDMATNGTTSTAVVIDANATTLRYFYTIPAAARGQDISFEFSAENSSGQTVSTKTNAYRVTNMDMVRNISMVGTPTGARYFSIADGKAYTLAEVDAGNLSGKIDFVYAYAATFTPTTTAYTYGHSFLSPSVTGYFPTGFSITPTWTKRTTKMERKIGNTLYDGQLKNDPIVGIYVDEVDLVQQEFNNSATFALTMLQDASIFMKTEDGKHAAFIYINSINNATSTAVISMKRLAL